MVTGSCPDVTVSYALLTASLGSVQFSSVAQSCPTLCNPMDCSTPGFPVHHQLLELTQTHVYWVVMPSNHLMLCWPLLLLPSIFLSIRVFSNESVLCITWPKYWSFSFTISASSEYSGLISWIFFSRTLGARCPSTWHLCHTSPDDILLVEVGFYCQRTAFLKSQLQQWGLQTPALLAPYVDHYVRSDQASHFWTASQDPG